MFNVLFKVCLLILTISGGMFVFAQGDKAYNDSLKQLAQKQIVDLKNGFLIVRLDTKAKQIAYYREHNNSEAANKEQEETRKFNQKIVDGMISSFNFCPVYFMDSKQTPLLLEGELAKITFYSSDMIPDSSIHVPTTGSYFIGEYSFTKDENMHSNSKEYYGSNNLGVPGIVIMDEKLNQLKRPFPYYCKFSSNLLNENKVKSKLFKWNTKLSNYYSLNNNSFK